MTETQPTIEVSRQKQNALVKVVMATKTDLPQEFISAVARKMVVDGMVDGHESFSDSVKWDEIQEPPFSHFLGSCGHEAENEAVACSLSWIRQTASTHGVLVTGSA